MITKKITYEDYKQYTGTSELMVTTAIDLFDQLVWKDGTFLYFDITDVNTFQLMQDKSGQLIAEITNDSYDMIFLQKFVTPVEARELIRFFYTSDEWQSLAGFYKVPINTTNLQKVMQQETDGKNRK